MIEDHKNIGDTEKFDAKIIGIGIRLALLSLLIFWSIMIISPFIGIAVWSIVLAVALYPVFEQMTKWLGGRRRLAAALITILGLLIVIGPTTWLGLGLVDALKTLYERFESGSTFIPPPVATVKSWPLIGNQIFQFWDLASTNLQAALVKVGPLLKPVGSWLLDEARSAGTGILQFLISVIIAGFLLSPGPSLVESVAAFLRRLVSKRGEEFLQLTGATIRNVSQGVIGVSLLQALLAGIGLMAAGVPSASLIAFGVLVLSIIQIGPALILIPVIIWSWMTMETTVALIFTAYMVPVNLLDNVLRPIIMTRGLTTPMLVILIGVIGGTLFHGIIGLFVGPIVLAVAWNLLIAWMREDETIST
jgi:predicted PurR-regulated permease PerM